MIDPRLSHISNVSKNLALTRKDWSTVKPNINKPGYLFKLWYSRVENSAINISLMLFASFHDCDCLYRLNFENHYSALKFTIIKCLVAFSVEKILQLAKTINN